LGFVSSVLASLVALLLVLAALAALAPALARAVAGRLERRMRLPYRQNLMGVLPVAQRVGLLGIAELRIRAATGKPPSRPMGSPRHLSPWEDLLFGFANVRPLPLGDDEDVSLAVTIGPAARRPLVLSHPVLVAPMSFGGALSLKARLALAGAATNVDTATNSGEGLFLPEERRAARHYIVQYHRGTWPTSPQNDPQGLEAADAIEVQVSQGAQGAAPMTTRSDLLHAEARRRFGLGEGESARIAARLKGVADPEDLLAILTRLKDRYDVPVGVKFAPSHRLEEELAFFLRAPIDFVTLDGAEGGTHGGPPVLQDDMGLPTLWAVHRARRFLEREGLAERVSILAAGGLLSPGHFLKAIALGACACYSGTLLAMALLSDQIEMPLLAGLPPYALDFQSVSLHERLDQEQALRSATNLLRALAEEMALGLRALGKARLQDLSRQDLVALRRDLAEALGVAFVGEAAPIAALSTAR
jgi:glutamate synthase domain-containing protein 2